MPNASPRVKVLFLTCLCLGLAALLAGQTTGLTAATQGSAAGSDAWAFVRSALAIFCVNIVLSGDNGVLIAMAAAKLPKQQKFRAIAIGAGISVIFQVAAAFFAFKVLHVRFVQLAGGLLIFWISIGLFRNGGGNKAAAAGSNGFLKVIWFILVADLTMSTDNILAVAAIANGSIPLLGLGLGLSIVVLVFASSFLSLVIEKYPLITFAGAAILGNVAANMLMTDAFTTEVFRPSPLVRYCVQALGALGVVAVGFLIQRRRNAEAAL